MNGILLLDKPLGLSSNAALQKVRRLLRAGKAGHVGSLDPLATGMLPICLGEATKIAGDILAGRKLYRFTIGLGTRTATGDTEGEVVERAPVPRLGDERLAAVLRGFEGCQTQVPPMYSALKRGGQPLYKLARAGVEVDRAPRPIEIYEIRVLSLRESSVELEALCSKGTYIRTLAEDIARALGTVGHVESLRRLHVEPFQTAPMHTLESVSRACEAGDVPPLLPPDAPLQHLGAIHLDSGQTWKLKHGQAVHAHGPAGRVRLYDAGANFIGIGESDGVGNVRPRRLFVSETPDGSQ